MTGERFFPLLTDIEPEIVEFPTQLGATKSCMICRIVP